jgi:hypothetical protein
VRENPAKFAEMALADAEDAGFFIAVHEVSFISIILIS